MVLDHLVSQSFEDSHSRTQTVEGGKCVYEQRHVAMRRSWILWQSSSPSQPTENENIQRTLKCIV